MSTEWVLLALRMASAGALLVFLGALFWLLWRDFRAVTRAGSAERRGRVVVVGLEGDAADELATLRGASWPLLPLTTLGRAPTNTIVLEDAFCSLEHAQIVWRGGQWWLEDRHSSNGTRLNDEPIREPVVVSSGDVIGVGRVQLRLELD